MKQRFYWWTTIGVKQLFARPSTPELDRLHAAWIREREKPHVNLDRYYRVFRNYNKAVDELFSPFWRGEVVPEGYLGSDFRLMLSPHRPHYIYLPEKTEVIYPLDIAIYTPMAVSERIAEVLHQFGVVGRSVQLIKAPLYEEVSGQYVGLFYLVYYLLKVPGVIREREREGDMEVVGIEIERSVVQVEPLFQVLGDWICYKHRVEVVRADLVEALVRVGITGSRFVPIVRVR